MVVLQAHIYPNKSREAQGKSRDHHSGELHQIYGSQAILYAVATREAY